MSRDELLVEALDILRSIRSEQCLTFQDESRIRELFYQCRTPIQELIRQAESRAAQWKDWERAYRVNDSLYDDVTSSD